MRQFESGATRSDLGEKLDYEGFLSPKVLERYAEYMHSHRRQEDGNLRDSDNWQKGMPYDVWMKSLWRHFMSMWQVHRAGHSKRAQEENCCAVLFNTMGYLHQLIEERERF